MNFNKFNSKKNILNCLPFIVFFVIVFTWHFTLQHRIDDLVFAGFYKSNIFNILVMRYETWTSRVLIEFFLVPLAALPPIFWNFFDSLIFLLMAVLIPKIALNTEKITEEKSFLYNILSCVIVLIYIFTTSTVLASSGYTATTLNYTWPLSFGLLHFYLVKRYVFTENKLSTGKKIVIYIIMLVALIFAINQELMLIVVSGAYFFIILYCLYNKLKIPNSILLIIFVIFLGFLNVFLCPGNHVRYSHEVTCFSGYYTLTLINKIDLGITVLLNRILLSYSLINIFFFLMLGVYLYFLTKRRVSILISLMPLTILITLLVMISIGYMPLVEFLTEAVTKYGLLRSDLSHILTLSILYAIIIFSVIYALIQMYQNGRKKLSYAIFCLLLLGISSQIMRGFSPACWESGERWEIYYYFCVAFATYLLSADLLDSRYDSFRNWLVKRSLWKSINNFFSSGKN